MDVEPEPMAEKTDATPVLFPAERMITSLDDRQERRTKKKRARSKDSRREHRSSAAAPVAKDDGDEERDRKKAARTRGHGATAAAESHWRKVVRKTVEEETMAREAVQSEHRRLWHLACTQFEGITRCVIQAQERRGRHAAVSLERCAMATLELGILEARKRRALRRGERDEWFQIDLRALFSSKRRTVLILLREAESEKKLFKVQSERDVQTLRISQMLNAHRQRQRENAVESPAPALAAAVGHVASDRATQTEWTLVEERLSPDVLRLPEAIVLAHRQAMTAKRTGESMATTKPVAAGDWLLFGSLKWIRVATLLEDHSRSPVEEQMACERETIRFFRETIAYCEAVTQFFEETQQPLKAYLSAVCTHFALHRLSLRTVPRLREKHEQFGFSRGQNGGDKSEAPLGSGLMASYFVGVDSLLKLFSWAEKAARMRDFAPSVSALPPISADVSHTLYSTLETFVVEALRNSR
eukprot:NODE_1323_length_1585_cov_38.420573_g1188_i0.p1 GENE.NODE_1323_length_1585_cov_38.420573_g1188_i0~~NODE_1323_length_1585_cov_38.420573_g1188_i0.p1  ORF type:complete len:497 (+),score=86.24 NODE_1323_length_1585_cov_38.420573_g1188_i0:76-1491(+)